MTLSAQSFNIVFVIWRECIEALLVIGILNAWIARRPDIERRTGRVWLWSGVGAGVAGAAGLSALLLSVGDALDDEAQDYFQTAIVFLAAALIVQMVFWMRANARVLKSGLHAALDRAASGANWLGVAVLAALAVLREGSEAAIFLYGTMAGAALGPGAAAVAVGFGLLLAGASYWALQVGGRVLPWRIFFRITEAMLLLLAAALMMAGIDHLLSLGLLPPLAARIWDTSALLDDAGVFGRFVSGLTGYRARPDLVQVIAFAGFWAFIGWRTRPANPPS